MTLHRRYILKAILLSGPIVLAACGSKPTMPLPTTVPPTPTPAPAPTATPDAFRVKVEAVARIKLPESASDLRAEFIDARNSRAIVRFTIPAADLPLTLRLAGYKLPLTEGNAILMSHQELAWWQPRAAKVLAGGLQGETGFMRRIGVDKTDPSQYIVYLEHLEL